MPRHTGRYYELDDVRIGPPDPEAIDAAPKDADVAASIKSWVSRAQHSEDIHYFAVFEGETRVGQIFLHDVHFGTGEALVGYHLFEQRFRGRGVGTKMLTLLQCYVREVTPLRRLVVITGDDNIASQHIALNCGFAHTGPPREDPVHGMCFEWRVPDATVTH